MIRSQNYLKFIMLSALFLMFAKPAGANETCLRIKGFADNLYIQQDYYRAVTEYKRYIYMCPSSPDVGEAMLKIGYSYQSGRQYDAAIFTFGYLLKSNTDDVAQTAQYRLGRTYMMKGSFDRAITSFNRYLRRFTDGIHINDSLYNMSWAYIEKGEYNNAIKPLSKLTGAMHNTASALSADILSLKKIIPHRSPAVSGVLSAIIPGAGQAYTGRYGDAFFSLLLNGLFAAGAYEAYTHKEYAVLGIVSFFGIGWYSGNIYGAITDSYHFNKKHTADYINTLKIKYGYH